MPRGCSRRFFQAARGVMMWCLQKLQHPSMAGPTAGPELTLNSAPWQGGLAEHCPVTASIPLQNIHLLAKPLSLFCVPTATAPAGARSPCCAMLCHVGPLHPCSQPQHPRAPRQGAPGVLIIFIPGAAAAVPTTGFWRYPPWRLGPLVSPESLRDGWGLTMPGRLCLFAVS